MIGGKLKLISYLIKSTGTNPGQGMEERHIGCYNPLLLSTPLFD